MAEEKRDDRFVYSKPDELEIVRNPKSKQKPRPDVTVHVHRDEK